MANVPETPSFDAGIYQIETTDPVLGGPNGIANTQAKGLANRTAYLKQQIDQLNSGQLTPEWIASQDYVQEQLQKLDAKQSVRAATTANITLSGVLNIDGVVLTVGDRVLVKDQTAAAQNGIYLVAAQGWTRATDADNGTKMSSGARIAVEEGSVNAGKVWFLSNSGAVIVGTTPLVFVDEHQQATEGTNGQLKIATQSQANAGTSDDVAITPKKLKWGFSASLNTNGYIAFPTWLLGLIIQWGVTPPIQSGGKVSITYPLAYPSSSFFSTTILGGSVALSTNYTSQVNLINNTTLDVYSYSSAGAASYRWLSIGV